ncbi:MAG: VCBS repeat-containing protein [Planctomycetaceae bacterium]
MAPRSLLRIRLLLGCLCCLSAHQLPAVEFQKLVLTSRYYCDGITSADINSDGHPDVVAGPFWYEGPTFQRAHAVYQPIALTPEASPSNSMFSFVHDFNNDGRPDILVLGRVHKHPAIWYRNPGATDGLWPPHFAFERVKGESPTLVDLDGDGIPQLICHWEGRWGFIAPRAKQPQAPWKFTGIGDNENWPQFYHGEGVGDVNGDGRPDLLINDGWYEQPADSAGAWTFHRQRFSKGRGGAQMFVYDVDADGHQDVISAIDGHGWGLAWYRQNRTDGHVGFQEMLIMGNREQETTYGVAFSQPHALALGDINGDGLPDVVTGKRRWAHGPTGDVEPHAAAVVYWFELNRKAGGQVRFIPHLIDNASGVGVQIHTADVNTDGKLDVLTASKLGTFVFLQK